MVPLNAKKLLLGLLIFFIFMLQFQVLTASATTNEEEAASALSNAEKAVASAYSATVNAEGAGANVSNLLVKLNDATNELSKAEVAFRQGDFSSTLSLANISSQVAEGVKVEADQLQLESLGPRYMDVWYKLLVSIFAVVGVGVGSIWAWRFFKRRYYQRVLELKPEAVSYES